MTNLKNALGKMAAIPQFFAWRLIWDAKERKFHKTPCFPDGSEYIMDARDPNNWQTYDDAQAVITRLRANDPARQYTLGFYLTRETGYWLLDVDKCVSSDGTWSPVASWLYNTLAGAGAMFEYSSSGTGIHLIGSSALPPERQIKPAGTGLELYSEGRGIAFGLSGEASGCADTPGEVASVMWHTVVPAYFPPKATNGIDIDGVGPRADWNGPRDDTDLLRRAMNSSSMGAKFGERATFADLFNGNREALAVAYPDGAGGVAESEADMALAMHLAFWTGCDADRMENLMRQSALYRPKWDEHATYLRKLTINNARATVSKVCQDKPVEPVGVTVTAAAPVSAVGQLIEGQLYVDAAGQLDLFRGCVYIVDDNKVFVPHEMGFHMLSAEQFSNKFGNYLFTKDKEGHIAKNAFEAFARSQIVKYPQADRAGFRPDLEPGCIFLHEGYTYVNTYIPFKPRRIVGDVSPFLRHVAMMLPVERDQQLLLSYLAACVQHKGVKFQWWPILQGMPGNGKSLLGESVSYALGGNFTHTPSSKELGEKFNDWLYEKLFIQVDEVRLPKGSPELMDLVKPMVTADRLQIESKGGKKRMRNVCANGYMTMNDKRNVLKEEGDRRFAIFYTAQQKDGDMERTGMTAEYMRGFVSWWRGDGRAIIAEWLHTFPIPVAMDPALNTRCPDTSSTVEVKVLSRDSAEEQILEAINEGAHGFKNGWVCWTRAKALFKYSIPNHSLETYLSRLGYIQHPGLGAKGYTNNGIFSEDGKQVRLYVTGDHYTITKNYSNAELSKIYENDQSSMRVAPPPPLQLVHSS